MRLRATLIALGAALIAAPATAQANVAPGLEVDASIAAAQSYWSNTIPTWHDATGRGCTAVPPVLQQSFTLMVTSGPEAGTSAGGEADFDHCLIMIDPTTQWSPQDFCIAVIHEWGHLTLGPDYFAASNPVDPMHAPEGTTGKFAVMQEDPSIYSLNIKQCESVEKFFDSAAQPSPTITIRTVSCHEKRNGRKSSRRVARHHAKRQAGYGYCEAQG